MLVLFWNLYIFLFVVCLVLHELIISRMLKSMFQLLGELYKLKEEGSAQDVCLVGIDGKTHIHLPLLIAANPWLSNSIDDHDQVHIIIMPDYYCGAGAGVFCRQIVLSCSSSSRGSSFNSSQSSSWD